MALSSKAASGHLVILDQLTVADGKTKALVASLAKLNLGRVLVIDGDSVETSFANAASNLPGVNALPAIGANVYDIIKADTLVLSRAGVEKLEARFNG
jgi:large subunit ribosomal protein L4